MNIFMISAGPIDLLCIRNLVPDYSSRLKDMLTGSLVLPRI